MSESTISTYHHFNSFKTAVRMSCILAVLVICLFCATAPLSTSYAQQAHPFEITLKPVVSNGVVSAIDVIEDVHGVQPPPGTQFRLVAPINYIMVTNIADRISKLTVRDAEGVIAFHTENDADAKSALKSYRHWIAERPVKFPVHIAYRATVEPPFDHSGPPFGMRPSGGGVAGAGEGFLLLPENGGTDMIRLHWDLSDLPKESVGVISSGEGDVELDGAPSKLNEQWMLAGPARIFREPGQSIFDGYVLGAPFDGQSQIAWAARSYRYLASYFRYLDPAPPYRVFVRILDDPPYGGGTTMSWHGGGFMMPLDKSNGARYQRNYIHEVTFHEMTHQWVGHNAADDSWFSEGMTVYYSLILPLRGDLESVDDFLYSLNLLARKYYSNPARNWTDKQIEAAGFAAEDTRQTPYQRGAFYFIDLDATIRAKSHGKKDLETVLYPLFVAREKGTPITQAVWEAMLQKELGNQAVADFHASILDAAKTIVPDSDAFGPCFTREAIQIAGADGKNIQGYSWKRNLGIPDADCRKP